LENLRTQLGALKRETESREEAVKRAEEELKRAVDQSADARCKTVEKEREVRQKRAAIAAERFVREKAPKHSEQIRERLKRVLDEAAAEDAVAFVDKFNALIQPEDLVYPDGTDK
jgi:nitric oxide reductase activation protein